MTGTRPSARRRRGPPCPVRGGAMNDTGSGYPATPIPGESLGKLAGTRGTTGCCPGCFARRSRSPTRWPAISTAPSSRTGSSRPRRRLTVLTAPGGFGKTTLLAECCRRLRQDGTPIAWVSVDDHDEPAVLDTYIAFACRSAVAGAVEDPERPTAAVGGQRSRSGAAAGPGLRCARSQSWSEPFVLVFDEVERLAQHQPPWPCSISLSSTARRTCTSRLAAGSSRSAWTSRVSRSKAVPRSCRRRICGSRDRRWRRRSSSTESSPERSSRRSCRSRRAGHLRSGSRATRWREGEGADPRAAQVIVENWVESRLFAGLDDLRIGSFSSISGCSSGWIRCSSTRSSSAPTRCCGSRTMSVLVGHARADSERSGTDVCRLHYAHPGALRPRRQIP